MFVSSRPQAFGAVQKMYCRIWSRCHAVSSSMGRRPALPGLAAAFESLLEAVAPDAARHCALLGFDPLEAALPWMVGGFVGVLEMDQLLLLWDRVIGYDSLLPLAVLAAGVFLFMQRAILVRARSLPSTAGQRLGYAAGTLRGLSDGSAAPLSAALGGAGG